MPSDLLQAEREVDRLRRREQPFTSLQLTEPSGDGTEGGRRVLSEAGGGRLTRTLETTQRCAVPTHTAGSALLRFEAASLSLAGVSLAFIHWRRRQRGALR